MSESTDEPKRKQKRPWWRTALEVGVIVAVFFAFRAYQTRDAAEGPAPPLEARTLAGAPVSLTSLAADGPVLVHFWATWCGVCQAEEGTIDALAEDHRVITVASQSGPPADVQAYLGQRGLSFDVINDPRGQLAHRWGVHAFPSSFVIGPDGTIRNVEVGYTTSLGMRARLWWAAL